MPKEVVPIQAVIIKAPCNLNKIGEAALRLCISAKLIALEEEDLMIS